MARSLPAATIAELNKETTASAFWTLIEISHANFSTVYLVDNTENVTSNAQVYTAFPFRITLPHDTDQTSVAARVVIPNATRLLIQQLRSIAGQGTRARAEVKIIDSADPDTVLASETNLQLANASYNADVLTCDLTIEQFLTEPFPGDNFSPANFPGLF